MDKIDPELLKNLLQDSNLAQRILNDTSTDATGQAQYSAMKQKIFRQSLLGAGFLALLYVAETQYVAAFVNLLSVGVGLLYFQMMIWEVERIDGKSKTLYTDILKIDNHNTRRFAMFAASYIQMAKPRFLLPIALAWGVSWWDATHP